MLHELKATSGQHADVRDATVISAPQGGQLYQDVMVWVRDAPLSDNAPEYESLDDFDVLVVGEAGHVGNM